MLLRMNIICVTENALQTQENLEKHYLFIFRKNTWATLVQVDDACHL